MEQVTLLWSGGFDSTYRLCQLSRQNVEVELVYIFLNARKFTKQEMSARNKILGQLRRMKGTRAILHETYVSEDDIPANAQITEAFGRLQPIHDLAEVYEPKARYAALHPGIEIGLEGPSGPPGHMSKMLLGKPSNMNFDENDIGTLNPEGTAADIYTVFGNFTFPIIHKSENEMLEGYLQEGFAKILKHVWVCGHPVEGNKACGVCGVCGIKFRHGIGHILGKTAVRNHQIYQHIESERGKHVAARFREYVWNGNKIPSLQIHTGMRQLDYLVMMRLNEANRLQEKTFSKLLETWNIKGENYESGF